MGKQRSALVLIVVLLLLVGGSWAITQLSPQEIVTTNASVAGHTQTPAISTPIMVYHGISEKTHEYTGSVTVDGSCTVLSSGIQTTPGVPSHITIILSTSKDMDCKSIATTSPNDFSLSFEARSAAAPIFDGVLVNGAAAAYSLAEVQ